MLASFLFTPKQQRVLAALLLHPDRDYSFTELHEQAGGGHSSLQTYTDILVRAGVASVRRDRASKRYRANPDHPLFSELRSIAIKSFGLVEPVREALVPLSALIDRAFIFGSIAKGTAEHDSDIDLMVIGSATTGKVKLALKPVEKVVGRPIHVNVYGTSEWAELSLSDPIIKSIAEGPHLELQIAEGAHSADDRPV